ncbi:MAG: hypothetical protein ACR2G7_09850 [Acidimicrobiales bacterium]
MAGSRREGRALTLTGATLGLVAAAGFALILVVGAEPPERSLASLAFPLVWAMPALLALLSLRSRPVLLVPATVVSVPLALTAFSGVTLVLLVPAVFYALAYRRRRPSPTTPARTALAVMAPVLATAGAVVVLLAHPDPLCWSYVEDRGGDRTYTTADSNDCGQEMGGGRIPTTQDVAVPPANPDLVIGPGTQVVASGGGSTSDTVTPAEAAGAAGLLAAGLAVAWTAGARRQPHDTPG